MIELILVRHGETDSNLKGSYCGWTDVRLNSNGKNQAFRAARKLRDINPDVIYSSPLRRALSTAKIMNRQFKKEIICLNSLKERNFGIYEDMTYGEILERYPKECSAWEKDWVNYCIKDGESAIHGYRIISEFIDSIVYSCKNQTVLIITHLGCIRYILAYLLDMNIEGSWRFSIDNGGVTKVVITDDNFAYIKAMNL